MKLVIFDLDDCLIDSWGASFPITIREAIKAMVKEGLKVESFEDAVNRLNDINTISANCPEAITKYLNEIGVNPEKYVEVGKNAIYGFNFDDQLKPLPGVLKMLDDLELLGIDFALVTKGEESRQLKKMRIAGVDPSRFRSIHAVSDYDKTIPYQTILRELGHIPKETLVVGDRYDTDLIPAKNLGTKVAWVAWGRGKLNPPKTKDVDYIVYDLSSIIKIVSGQRYLA